MDSFNLIPLYPELFLGVCAMMLLLQGAFFGNELTRRMGYSALVTLLIVLVVVVNSSWKETVVLNGMFRMDNFAGTMKVLILAGLMFSIALSVNFLPREGMSRFEYPILILFAGIGMMLMVSAHNFLALYMSLELQSLSLYVLAAFHRDSNKSAEAGVKYFALGAISSGMILFGISMIYGFTGSLDYGAIKATMMTLETVPMGVTFGLVFLLAGLAFKISAAPFHMWTPDVYQGAPTAVTALFAIVPKVAAMALIMRLVLDPFEQIQDQWFQIIWFLSAASMVLSAFAAIAQENIKRLLAYSSIGNMGYALVGVAAATPDSVSAVILYMLIYMVMTAGAFGVLLALRRGGVLVENISDLSGLSQSRKGLAMAMAILMFSMSGIPPMAGFFGKLLIFKAAIDQELYVLSVLGVLSSVIAAYYYLRIIKVMFFDAPAQAFDADRSFLNYVVILASVLFVIGFIAYPGYIVERTQIAAVALFPS